MSDSATCETSAPVADRMASPETNRHFGDDYYGRPRFQKLLPHFSEQGTILDFGCCEGIFLHFLRTHGRTGLGVDYDREAVEACAKHGLDAIHADIFAFTRDPENRDKFAGVMMADFIEHFDPYPLQELLRQTVGVLRPGGTMVLITPNSRSIGMIMGGFYDCTIEHHNLYSIPAVAKFLEGEGMEIVESGPDPDSRPPIFSWHPLRFARQLATAVLGRILCGKSALHHASYLVAKKVENRGERFADRVETGSA